MWPWQADVSQIIDWCWLLTPWTRSVGQVGWMFSGVVSSQTAMRWLKIRRGVVQLCSCALCSSMVVRAEAGRAEVPHTSWASALRVPHFLISRIFNPEESTVSSCTTKKSLCPDKWGNIKAPRLYSPPIISYFSRELFFSSAICCLMFVSHFSVWACGVWSGTVRDFARWRKQGRGKKGCLYPPLSQIKRGDFEVQE